MNGPVEPIQELSDSALRAIADPEVLLEHIWALEPLARWTERARALDRLQDLLDSGSAPEEPEGRAWQLELLAERANDAGRAFRVSEALELTDRILREAGPTERIALGRAQLAAGQALAWTGTDAATQRGDRAFAEAAEHFAALGKRDWQGSALLRRGYAVWFQSAGDLRRAKELVRSALETYEPGSPRIPAVLGYYADILINLGELDAAEKSLDEGRALAERDGIGKALGEITWIRASLAAARGDARTTERLLREAEREAAQSEWFDTHIGTSLLLEAAELLDRVGLREQADEYFDRACSRADATTEEVMHTRAVLLARSGDPLQALDALQAIVRGNWLEKRRVWQHLLLTAWATFRAGRAGAGELAAHAFDQAIATGGTRVAQTGEADLTAALAPLAERAGSAPARSLLVAEPELIVRLFAEVTVKRADGTPIQLPAGKPGELVRMLALHEHGLHTEVVLAAFFPDAPAAAARQRLRQVLTRLRAAAGPIVVRDDDHLRLIPAWVDVREFLTVTNRIRSTTGPRTLQLAYAALALLDGPLLPTDRYAAWAEETRNQINYRHLAALDLIATSASANGSHHEALTALETAAQLDPGNPDRQTRIADQLRHIHGPIGGQ